MNMKIFFDLQGVRRTGIPVRFNTHTTWFRVARGARTYDYIKRHNIKHNVVRYEKLWERGIDETFYTTIRHVLSTG